ncbi:MAG: carboxypeptidase-like regulatory domain-containing protein [Parcubacteria group bacterium]
MRQKKDQKFNSAFTIIEALLVLFIFSVVTMTFYSVFTLGVNYIFESKSRLGAVSLANEKMEIIRNLKYDDVGIVGGIPSGMLLAEEDVYASKKRYHVKTFVQYIDDPFDGVSPIDLDYKRVKVTVSWLGPKGNTSVMSLVSRFVPPGMEQSISGGGVLSINVMNSKGIGVPQASVHVINNALIPKIDVTAMTDNTGNLMLPGAPQSIGQYYITVTKGDYETVNTIDPVSVTYSVTDTPASVVGGMMNVKSLIQDQVSGLKIATVDTLGVPLPGVNFHAEGGRILGFDMAQSPAAPIYNIKSDNTTDAEGKKEFLSISPGQIFITPLGPPPVGYTLVKNSYFTEYNSLMSTYSFILAPAEPKEVILKYADNNAASLLMTVKNNADSTLISNAKVILSNADGYSEEVITGKDGTAFFPGTSSPLVLGSYNLKVVAEGYAELTEENIIIDKLILKESMLTVI